MNLHDGAYSKSTDSLHLHKNDTNFHTAEHISSYAGNEIDEEFYRDCFDKLVRQYVTTKRVCGSRNAEKQKGSAAHSLETDVISNNSKL